MSKPFALLSYHIMSCFLRCGFSIQVGPFLLLNMFLHVSWRVHLIRSSGTFSATSLSSLLQKRDALLEDLNYFLCNSVGINKPKTILAYRVSTLSYDFLTYEPALPCFDIAGVHTFGRSVLLCHVPGVCSKGLNLRRQSWKSWGTVQI